MRHLLRVHSDDARQKRNRDEHEGSRLAHQ
jgi:hypothetical protein